MSTRPPKIAHHFDPDALIERNEDSECHLVIDTELPRLQVYIWRILYLDGIHFSVRHGDQADPTVILTALGVDLAGNKEVLALRACAEESKPAQNPGVNPAA